MKVESLFLREKELSFAIEGRNTNLRVWKSKGLIYMRIDCFKQYSAPLSKESIKYLYSKNDIIEELVRLGGFEVDESKESEIALLLSQLKPRNCRKW